jgi:hypothetical protein
MAQYEVVPIGWVESPLTDRAQAPCQGEEGAPPAWIVFEPAVAEGIRDLCPGTEVLVLTWLVGEHACRAVFLVPGPDLGHPCLEVRAGQLLARLSDRAKYQVLHSASREDRARPVARSTDSTIRRAMISTLSISA